MSRNIFFSILVAVFVLLAGLFLSKEQAEAPVVVTEVDDSVSQTPALADHHRDASYLIEGDVVTLVDGYSETVIGSDGAAMKVTRYFGNEVVSDLDGDGDYDVAFIVTQTTGGTGIFYYAVAALATEDGYDGSDGYLLGDRIAPQSTHVSVNPRHKNVVVFNFADRKGGEPMISRPSIGKSVYLKIVPETNRWAIVEPDPDSL